jgi:hypothetical protein
MFDFVMNIVTWVLIMAGFLLFVGLIGLSLFMVVEKMND